MRSRAGVAVGTMPGAEAAVPAVVGSSGLAQPLIVGLAVVTKQRAVAIRHFPLPQALRQLQRAIRQKRLI